MSPTLTPAVTPVERSRLQEKEKSETPTLSLSYMIVCE